MGVGGDDGLRGEGDAHHLQGEAGGGVGLLAAEDLGRDADGVGGGRGGLLGGGGPARGRRADEGGGEPGPTRGQGSTAGETTPGDASDQLTDVGRVHDHTFPRKRAGRLG